VALFFPGVAIHVISVLLPEAGLIVVEELECAGPLHGFPRVEVWHDQSQRIAVVQSEWHAVVMRGEQDVVTIQVSERYICGEALFRVNQDESGARF